MSTEPKVALVVGARGVIGGRLVEHLSGLGDWEVIGLSRRGGEPAPRVRHVAVDLLDAAQSQDRLRDLSDVTHVFYAAFQDRPTWSGLVEPNVGMLRNVLDAIEPTAPRLAHVSLMSDGRRGGRGPGRPSAHRWCAASGSATR